VSNCVLELRSKLPRPFTILIGRDQEADRGADQHNNNEQEQIFHCRVTAIFAPLKLPSVWISSSGPKKSPSRQLPFRCLTLCFRLLSNNVFQRERRAHLPRLQLTTRDPALQRRSSSDRRATCGYDRGQPFYIGI
jgi:hypothetical protein